jgi:hypothetical protein
MSGKDGTVTVTPEMEKMFVLQGRERWDARELAKRASGPQILEAFAKLARAAAATA